MNSPRVANGAAISRGRHDNTIDDANAFVPEAIILLDSSVLIGHVAVTVNPASMIA